MGDARTPVTDALTPGELDAVEQAIAQLRASLDDVGRVIDAWGRAYPAAVLPAPGAVVSPASSATVPAPGDPAAGRPTPRLQVGGRAVDVSSLLIAAGVILVVIALAVGNL